jgi:hypothetical protein
MAIDSSIALNAAGNQPNILQNMMGVTQLRGQIQAQKSNSALSRILQQSIDPATGQPDMNKALSMAAKDPDAAYNLPAFQAQILQQKNNQLQYDTGQLEQAQKRTDNLSAGFGSLLGSQTITPQNVMKVASEGIKLGLYTPEEAVSFTTDMPTDPGALRDWVKQKYIGFSQNSDRLKSMLPQTQIINSGGSQQIMNIDPSTGQPTLTGQVQNSMAPGDANSMVTIFDPQTGTQRMVTKAQAAAMANGQGAQPGYTPDTSGGPMGSGRLTPITGGAPGIQAGPSLGAAGAADVVGKGAAEASLALQQSADNAPQAIYQLQNMRSSLGDISTGPNADWQGKAQALALQVAPGVAQRLGIDPQKVASLEEFKKFSTQLAQSVAGQLGEGTDSKLASAVAANPNSSLSKLGNEQIIDVLIATQRATQAKNSAWQAAGLPAEQYNKFSSQWNKDVDPRLFTLQDMPRDKAVAMRNSLKPTEQKAFDASYNKAVAQGLIQRIGQ